MRILLPVLFAIALAGCATPKQYRSTDVADTDISKLGVYSLLNTPDFFAAVNLITKDLDGVNYHKHPDAVSPELGVNGEVHLAPGKHQVKVSFVDFDMLGIGFRSRVFQGHYDIEFTVTPGNYYAAMFKDVTKEKRFKEVCVVEVSQKEGLMATRTSKNFIACGTPTVLPTEDNIKVCQLTLGVRNYYLDDDACKSIGAK
jgi:hypothetical protein